MRYAGPIIDAHTHLWDLSMGRHGWLTQAGTSGPLGGLQAIARTHLVDDYLHETAGQGIVASVHVEALWDATDPLGETRWLETLDKSAGIASRYTASAPLGTDAAAAVLEQLAAVRRVVGIRQILSFHPHRPERSFAPSGQIADNPAWQRDVARLARLGLLLELMIYPFQLDQVVALARRNPALTILVNHCASPIDRDAEGMARWRGAVRELAAEPNVAIKLSNAAAYDPQPTPSSLSAVLRALIEAFGPERAIFGSDWPVAKLSLGIGATWDVARDAVADLTPGEQRALFHDTAARLYRF